MDKIKAQITNNRLDGFSEIKIIGDIGKYDGSYLAGQIDNLVNLENYTASKNLRIRINSFGGDVRSGFSIVSAMQRFMDAGGTIETLNEGCADSTAGWIGACGTRGRRQVMQFASGYLHAPMFADGRTIDQVAEGSEEKAVLMDHFDKLISIFVSATDKPYSRIKELMMNETKLNADELVKEGFADERVLVNNAPRIKNGITRAEIVNLTNGLEFDIKKENAPVERENIINMKSINSILNLNPAADENATRQAIEALINGKAKAETDLATVTTDRDTIKTELTNLKKTVQEEEDAEIINYVDKLIEKDARKKDQKESLINMAKVDFDTFKATMPLEKVVVNGEQIDAGLEAEASSEADVKKKGIENATKFNGMDPEEKDKLRNENLKEYKELAGAYEKHFSEIK